MTTRWRCVRDKNSSVLLFDNNSLLINWNTRCREVERRETFLNRSRICQRMSLWKLSFYIQNRSLILRRWKNCIGLVGKSRFGCEKSKFKAISKTCGKFGWKSASFRSVKNIKISHMVKERYSVKTTRGNKEWRHFVKGATSWAQFSVVFSIHSDSDRKMKSKFSSLVFSSRSTEVR